MTGRSDPRLALSVASPGGHALRDVAAAKAFIAWTDGACAPNPGKGGWGFVLQAPDDAVSEACGGESNTTNNRMELTAILMALRAVPSGQAVIVKSDSSYCVNGLTKWRAAWRRKDWCKPTGPIPNRDLWMRLEEELLRVQAVIVWVRGHSGDPGNERADVLASCGQRGRASNAMEVHFG